MKLKGVCAAVLALALSGCASLDLLTNSPEVVTNEVNETGQRVIATNFTEISTVMEAQRRLNGAIAYKAVGDDTTLLFSNSLMGNTPYEIEEGSSFIVLLKDGTTFNLKALEAREPCMRCTADDHLGHLDIFGTVSSYAVTLDMVQQIRDVGPDAVRLYTTVGYAEHDLNEAAETRWKTASDLFLQELEADSQ